ncbi:MAG: sensor histidine kinase [Terracidiphilus sp.]
MNLKMIQPAPTTNVAAEPPAASSRIGILGPLVVCSIATAFALIVANECHHIATISQASAPYAPSLFYGIVSWFWWAVFAFTLWGIAARWPSVLAFTWKNVFLHLGAACLVAFIHLSLLQNVVRWASATWPSWGAANRTLNVAQSLWRYEIDIVVYSCIYGFAGFLFAQAQAQRAAVQKLDLERKLSEAQLQALQAQIEPHFLFNTLNAITSLVAQGRNQEAMNTLAHLNTILRMSLQRKAPEKVPFAEELGVVESYLAIQQVRFAGRLQVKIDATPEALDGLVPCFLLQPIVENAVQHGIAPMEAGGLIETSVKRVGDTLRMEVKDNGCGPNGSGTKGHGIGMQNVRERLAYFYPGAHEFDAVAPATGGYEVTIQIPYERAMA